jgi:carboxynorspermidine decarboxylase
MVFLSKFGKFLPKLKWVNMGGGHLITKKNYGIDHLIQILIEFKNKYDVKIILEPGSAFTYQTGYLVSTNSSRRFLDRSSSFLLGTMGLSSP